MQENVKYFMFTKTAGMKQSKQLLPPIRAGDHLPFYVPATSLVILEHTGTGL